MNTTQENIQDLWLKYLAGTCTREEMGAFWEVLGKLPPSAEGQALMQAVEAQLQQSWDDPKANPPLTLSPDWNQLWQEIEGKTMKRSRVVGIRRYWPAVAALFLLAISLYLLRGTETTVTKEPILAKAPEKVLIPVVQNRMVLPDGSVVILKGNAKILTPEFNRFSRTVSLEGEAYFDVKHDASRPFIVKAKDIRIRVLGTAFLVSAIPGHTVEVKVTRGRVEVSHQNEVLGIITPEQSIVFNDTTQQAVLNKHIDTTGIMATTAVAEWKWKEVKLEEVIAWLNEQYQVTIRISDEKIAQTYFTASFLEPLTLQDVLDVIEKLYHLKVSRLSGDLYELSVNPS